MNTSSAVEAGWCILSQCFRIWSLCVLRQVWSFAMLTRYFDEHYYSVVWQVPDAPVLSACGMGLCVVSWVLGTFARSGFSVMIFLCGRSVAVGKELMPWVPIIRRYCSVAVLRGYSVV